MTGVFNEGTSEEEQNIVIKTIIINTSNFNANVVTTLSTPRLSNQKLPSTQHLWFSWGLSVSFLHLDPGVRVWFGFGGWFIFKCVGSCGDDRQGFLT